MKSFIYSLAILFVLAPIVTTAQSIPNFPMAFWGVVTINGSPAPVGTIVRAYYSSVLAGTATVQDSNGTYGYTEPTKQKLIVGEGTGPINFTLQLSSFNGGTETAGNSAISYDNFVSGLTVQKDLNFAITIPTTSSSGGSGGGSSGGGGGAAPVAQTTTSVVKGDANGDGKVDIFDFNALLIQWGKTGANLTADFDKNGVVDIFDFNLLLINWSK
jgi:hypothetical protein